VVSDDDVAIEDCVLVTTTKILDPYPTASETTQCGCEVLEDDYALMINVGCDLVNQTNGEITDCNSKLLGIKSTPEGYALFFYKNYDIDGNEISGNYSSIYASRECCKVYGGESFYHEEWSDSDPNVLMNSGYVCCFNGNCGCGLTCNWRLSTTNIMDMPILQPYGQRFLSFLKPSGQTTVVTPSGCSCIAGYTTPVQGVVDPNSGEVGVGCMLTEKAYDDLSNTTNYYYLQENRDGSYSVVGWAPNYDSLGNNPVTGFYYFRHNLSPIIYVMNTSTGQVSAGVDSCDNGGGGGGTSS
jgi:hypothetical protein